MQWDSYATREYDGRRFGMKSESFMKYLDLPRRVGPVFEMAVGGAEAQMLLEEHGWGVRNPNKLIPDPPSFQRFVQSSKAEFTVAKQGYVSTRSGWFSDRSAAYLASGRPVITENTGCGDWLAVGEGCLTFDDIDEAIQAISEVNHHYDRHCSHGARDRRRVLRRGPCVVEPDRAGVELGALQRTCLDTRPGFWCNRMVTGVVEIAGPRRPHVAFFDYPDVFEDFYPHYGVDQDAFATRFAGTGNHAFVSLLQREIADVVWYEFAIRPALEEARHEVVGCRVRMLRSSWAHRLLWRAFYLPKMAWRWRGAYRAYATVASYLAPLSFAFFRALTRDRPDVILAQSYASGRFDLLLLVSRLLRVPLIAYHAGGRPEQYPRRRHPKMDASACRLPDRVWRRRTGHVGDPFQGISEPRRSHSDADRHDRFSPHGPHGGLRSGGPQSRTPSYPLRGQTR